MSANLDDILDAFSMEADPTSETLKSYLQKYPQYVVELTNLYQEIRLGWLEVEQEQIELRGVEHKSVDSIEPIDVNVALTGDGLKSMAKALNVTRMLVVAMRDGRIQAATFPEPLLDATASYVGLETQLWVVELESRMAGAHSRLAFKSAGKPSDASGVLTYQAFLETLPDKDKEQLISQYGRD